MCGFYPIHVFFYIFLSIFPSSHSDLPWIFPWQVMPVSASISCSARRLALIDRRLAAGCGTAAATALGLTMEFEHSCLTEKSWDGRPRTG